MYMASFKILFDRNKCIGAYTCVQEDPDSWKPADDGKVNLEKSKQTSSGIFERVVPEAEVEKARTGAAVCPVSAIQVMQIK